MSDLKDNDNLLTGAAQHGDVAAIERLLAAGADANARDWEGVPALMLAAEGGTQRQCALLGCQLSCATTTHAVRIQHSVISHQLPDFVGTTYCNSTPSGKKQAGD